MQDRPKSIDEFIPENSSLIIKIHNLGKFKSDIKNNDVLNEIRSIKYNTKKQLELINNFNDETELLICISKNINASSVELSLFALNLSTAKSIPCS